MIYSEYRRVSLFPEKPSVSMCLLRCPLIESKLLPQWFSEELWSLRREWRYFTFGFIRFCVVSSSLFATSKEKSLLTKKIALGVARLLFILPEEAGVVCKHDAFRGWL